MKPEHHSLFLLLVFTCSVESLFAQTIEDQMTKSHPSCYTMLMNAMDLLPKLYREGSFDSLSKAVEIWERSCNDMPEVRITRILLNMEEANFNVLRDVDINVLKTLDNYAKSLPAYEQTGNVSVYFEPEMLFHRFSSTWAKFLLENKKLN